MLARLSCSCASRDRQRTSIYRRRQDDLGETEPSTPSRSATLSGCAGHCAQDQPGGAWSRRPGAENYQEQSASAREAAETLVAIESADSARAAPDGPNGPNPCALSAHGARGSGCSCAHQFCAATWPYCSMRTFELLGRSWVLDMCMLRVAAVRDPCPGSVWTRQPIGMCWRACMRV